MKIQNNKYLRWQKNTADLPKISIVTPCLNHVDYIEATILSVLNQQYPNLDYIVIDGNSTDGSKDIISSYSKYFSYWTSRSDNGQYEAINDGFARSGGEIMAWINSDDMLHRNALWTVAEIFQRFPEVEWIMGTPTHFDRSGRTINVSQIQRWSKFKILRGEWQWIQQESVFWRRKLWSKTGGNLDSSYKYAADFELWTRFFRVAKLYPVRTIIGGFRSSSNEQKGRKYRSLYLEEVNRIIKREQKYNRKAMNIAKLEKYLRLFLLPLRGRYYKALSQRLDCFFQYPAIIGFDQKIYCFVLE